MKSILITGCNRGLGLGLVKNLAKLKNPPEHIITTCRDLQKAEELRDVAKENKNVHVLQFDVKEFDTYNNFVEKVTNIVKEDGLNVLFNNAGISPKYARIQFVKLDSLLETFGTNTVAPIMLTKALLPLIKKAADKNTELPLGVQRGAVINMSSILGSIAYTEGGLYPYRCSKAALNMATASMCLDLKKDNILVTAIHPGWVKTAMGGAKAPMDVDSSTSAIIDLLYNLKDSHNGGFYQWDGSSLPW